MRVLSFIDTHDSSVCVINNGIVEFFCKEERLSRNKRDMIPILALETYKKLNKGPIDYALYNTPTDPGSFNLYSKIIKKYWNIPLINNSHLQHHKSHASLAFYNSGFEECLVFVIDRHGSIFFVTRIHNHGLCREAESIFMCSGISDIIPLYKSLYLLNELDYLKEDINTATSKYFNCKTDVKSPNSIVGVYEAATTMIGQPALDNGKTMGLASYGENIRYSALFNDDGTPIDNYFSTFYNDILKEDATIFSEFKELRTLSLTEHNFQFYANLAKQVQQETQEVILRLIKQQVEETGIHNVCIVGGYGLNVVANNYFTKNLPTVNFYFEPVADDTGISTGAALYRSAQITGIKPEPIKDTFYHFYEPEEIGYGQISLSVEDICDLLIEGKSVAIFEGQPEAGPRALGHRSILFNPMFKNGKDVVNQIKKREWYRPFAGVILEEFFSEYFHTVGLKNSPNMTLSFDCKEKTMQIAPAVVHIDNTCRVQTVRDGFLYTLITAFYKRTKCPILLNTSLNLAGEPLIQTKKEARYLLQNSSLDALYYVDEGMGLLKSVYNKHID